MRHKVSRLKLRNTVIVFKNYGYFDSLFALNLLGFYQFSN